MPRGAFVLLLLLVGLCTPVCRAFSGNSKTILILHFERPQASANIIASRAFEQVFAGKMPHQFFDEYLDETRLGNDYSGIATALQQKYAHRKIDLVITVAPQAFGFLMRYGDRLWPSIPKVSCCVDLPEIPHTLPPGMHVIGTPLNFAPTVDLARQLQPDIRHVFYIEGASPQEIARLHATENELRHYPSPPDFTYINNLSWSQLLDRVAQLPPHSAILFSTYFSDSTGEPFTSSQACKAIAAVSNAPVYGIFDTLLDHCIVGGLISSVDASAKAAAELSLRILNGEVSPNQPLVERIDNKTIVDARELSRWNIPEALVPAHAIVINRDPSIWQRYRRYIIVIALVLLLESIFIIILLLERHRRLRSERAVRLLTQRLINASEEERSHLARELHDDVGQRLSMLSFQLGSLHDISPTNHAAAIQVDSALLDLKSLISDIHKLSHRLHSSKLEYLGLKSAMAELCRHLEQTHDVSIELEADQIPASTPRQVSLCLYRVAQEALNNAIRHSGAHLINVRFSRTEKNLVMKISDKGQGFDRSTGASGLGLIAMEERVRILDGSLRIISSNLSGTTVQAALPITG